MRGRPALPTLGAGRLPPRCPGRRSPASPPQAAEAAAAAAARARLRKPREPRALRRWTGAARACVSSPPPRSPRPELAGGVCGAGRPADSPRWPGPAPRPAGLISAEARRRRAAAARGRVLPAVAQTAGRQVSPGRRGGRRSPTRSCGPRPGPRVRDLEQVLPIARGGRRAPRGPASYPAPERLAAEERLLTRGAPLPSPRPIRVGWVGWAGPRRPRGDSAECAPP